MELYGLKLVQPLASGAGYQTFLVEDSHGDRKRLVRWLDANKTAIASGVTRIAETLRCISLATHRGLLPIDFVEDEECDLLATTTPYLHGRSLSSAPGFVPAFEAWAELVESLAAAHQLGIAHAKLSPSTVYVDDASRLHVDLVDGLLERGPLSSSETVVACTQDVADLGRIWSSSSATTADSRAAHLEDLLIEMQAADWTERPSMSEVLAALNQPAQRVLSEDATLVLPAGVAASAMILLQEGDTTPVLGRFAIERSLGQGGMGTVYLGRDHSNDQCVAIKVLSQHLMQDEKASKRFAKEARLLSTLDHPSIARLIEFNRINETLYIAMEYMPGGCLADFTTTKKPISEKLAIAAIAEAARGLAVAHQNGLVHRDIKPANLLLSQRGRLSFEMDSISEAGTESLLKVADFGLAKRFDAEESLAITKTGMILGTPLYMAPEQCRSQSVSPATDVYALGVTLFQCLTGKVPFQGESHVEVFQQHCEAPIPSVRTQVSHVSDAVNRVIEKCLAKSPLARYQNASELLNDLEQLLEGKPTSIARHPIIPNANANGILTYRFEWNMRSSPEALWPFVSNTDRVNHAIGLPSVQYRNFYDPKLGLRRMASVRAMGLQMEWEEHPYEWIEGRRLSVLRQFASGPFEWFTNIVEMEPQMNGGTRIVQTLQMLPRNFLGRCFARFKIGNTSERNFGRVYEKIDAYLQSDSVQSAIENPYSSTSRRMTREQKRRLDERFQRVRAAAKADSKKLDLQVLDLLEQYLEFASELEIARLRPIAFAERFGLVPDQVVQACLLAAREGCLILLWDILCPTCRIPSDVKETLRGLAEHGHCEACNMDFELDFAQSIELIFRAHPEIRNSETRTYCIGGPAFSSHVVAQIRLAGDERIVVPLRLSDGQYRLRGPQLPYVLDFRVSRNGKVGRWDIDLARPTAKHEIPILRSGEQALSIHNSQSLPLQVRVERLASRLDALTAADAARLPSFREWFPDELLSPGQMVSLTTVTLLGCKLADAARIYASMPDQAACAHVLKHIHHIAGIVAEHQGCVVKTMNDGLHIVFPNVGSAVQASQELLQTMNQSEVNLQLSLHQGSAVVATINDRLDYFGETPQFMEAMLNACGANELWMSEGCWSEIGNQILQNPSWQIEFHPPLAKSPQRHIVRAVKTASNAKAPTAS